MVLLFTFSAHSATGADTSPAGDPVRTGWAASTNEFLSKLSHLSEDDLFVRLSNEASPRSIDRVSRLSAIQILATFGERYPMRRKEIVETLLWGLEENDPLLSAARSGLTRLQMDYPDDVEAASPGIDSILAILASDDSAMPMLLQQLIKEPKADAALVRLLARLLTRKSDCDLKVAIAGALCECALADVNVSGRVVTTLVRVACHDSCASAREATVVALKGLATKYPTINATPLVHELRLIYSANISEQLMGTRALGTNTSRFSEATPALIHIADNSTNATLKIEAIKSLGKLGTGEPSHIDQAIPTFKKMLAEKEPESRLAALEAVSALGPKSRWKSIVPIETITEISLTDPDGNVRNVALKMLR